jgi:hypothetical protein
MPKRRKQSKKLNRSHNRKNKSRLNPLLLLPMKQLKSRLRVVIKPQRKQIKRLSKRRNLKSLRVLKNSELNHYWGCHTCNLKELVKNTKYYTCN